MASFYIARQPILDAANATVGYELLFRSTETNAYDASVDGDAATARVLINTVVEAGLDSIVGNAQAFVNLTQRFLESPEALDLLTPGRCVLEVLEDVVVTDAVLAGVVALHAKGHTIALDDFVDPVQFAQLMPLAHLIKYDITQHSMQELERYRYEDAAAGRRSLAERVETLEQFEQLKSYGFHYFQGYYFAKPQIVSGTKLPQNKIAMLQLLAEINDGASTIDELAEMVSRDVALSVRVLKYVNSPLSGLRSEVTSIRHATLLLGREPIRNWVTLLVMAGMEDKPVELTKMALTRARFCQLMAQAQGLGDESMYFTIGLLSLMGALMNLELEAALHEIPISSVVRDQLLNGGGDGGAMLSLLGQLESRDPDIAPGHPGAGPIYQQAIGWSEQTFGLLQ